MILWFKMEVIRQNKKESFPLNINNNKLRNIKIFLNKQILLQEINKEYSTVNLCNMVAKLQVKCIKKI